MVFVVFLPGGFGYVRPPSTRSRADYDGHSVLKEAEGGCRGKSLLYLIQALFALDSHSPLIAQGRHGEESTKAGAEPQA